MERRLVGCEDGKHYKLAARLGCGNGEKKKILKIFEGEERTRIMQNNFLEELVAEWLEYNGYIVKRNERVGRRERGGYEGELDIVAFNPVTNHLTHVEAEGGAASWDYREKSFKRKFATGDRYIKALFEGLTIPDEIEKKAILYGSNRNHRTIGGGQVVPAKDYLLEILRKLKTTSFMSRVVPEKYPILRILQMVTHYWKYFVEELK